MTGSSSRGDGLSRAPDLESSTPAYARRFRGSVGRWFLDVQERAVRGLLGDLPTPSRLLDVGGGHAQLAPSLVRDGHHVVVAGSRPEAAGLLPSDLAGGRLDFVATELLRLPFPPGYFDAVLCVRVLSHIRDRRAFQAELCRVASGPVIVDYTSRRSFNAASRALYWLKDLVEEQPTRRFRLLGAEAVDRAFRAAGHRVRGTRRQFFWPMALHRAHGSAALARALEGPARAVGLTARFGSPVVVRADPAP